MLALCLVTLVTVSSASGDEAPSLRLHHDCDTLDPIGVSSGQCYRLATDVYEGLLRVGPDGAVQPGVAESWDYDFDAKTLSVNLRDDRHWSDGTPVTAADFVLSWKRSLMNPDAGNPLVGALRSIRGAERCEAEVLETCAAGLTAPNERTIEIEFANLDRTIMDSSFNGPLMPVPAHFIAEHGEDWAARPDRPYNGAYMAAPGQNAEALLNEGELHLVPNPLHPDRASDMIQDVAYERSTADLVTSVRDLVLKNDNPDIVFSVPKIGPESEAYLKQNGWSVENQNNIVFTFFAFDLPQIDPLLLETLKLLMQPGEIVKRTSQLAGEPISRIALIPAAAPMNNRIAAMTASERNEKAAKNLEELGVDRNNPAELNILVFDDEGEEQLGDVANILRRSHIQFVPVRAAYGERRARFEQGDAVGLLVAWFSSTNTPETLSSLLDWTATTFSPDGNQAVFDAFGAAAKLPDDELAVAIARIEEHVINDGGIVPIFRTHRKIIYRDSLCGVTGNLTLTSPALWIRNCDDQ